jgi:hypothetical protein
MSQSNVMIESLEGRRLFSAAVVSAASARVASPAEIVKPAILGPSAVEGTYKGTATGDGTVLGLKLVVTAKVATLTIEGYGSDAVALSASAFKKLRDGTFSYDGKIKGYTVKLSGKVTDSGLRISGTGSVTGSSTISGVFSLKK